MRKKVLGMFLILGLLFSMPLLYGQEEFETTAIHPLIGKWKFVSKIGGVKFTDYVTITKVNTKSHKVQGKYYSTSVIGYFYENICFLETKYGDFYIDGWYFTFSGTPVFKKHLGICSIFHDFDSNWHSLSVKKVSGSTAVSEANDNIYAQVQIMKLQAQIAAKTEIEDQSE